MLHICSHKFKHMPKFITRIELQDAENKDYEKLDVELKKASFIEVLTCYLNGTSRINKKLYSWEGNVDLQRVTSAAYSAAKRINKRFSFTIIKDKGYTPLPLKKGLRIDI